MKLMVMKILVWSSLRFLLIDHKCLRQYASPKTLLVFIRSRSILIGSLILNPLSAEYMAVIGQVQVGI